MRRLGGQETAFLYAETPTWHMHVSAVAIVDPSTSGGHFSFDALKQMTVDRLPSLPQFRWRPFEVPLGVDRPVWVEADEFDPDYHIRRITVPVPGGREEFDALVGRLISSKIDRTRPLWEMWVVEGRADSLVGVLTKVHHSIIDGVSGAGLAEILFDLEPNAERPVREMRDSLRQQAGPNALRLFGEGILTNTIATPLRMMRFGTEIVRKGITIAGMLRSDRPPTAPLQAPRTRFNAQITPHRSFAAATVPLDRVKAIARAHNVKLNDVVLALCAGALVRYLEHHGELPNSSLVAQVPVSLRVEGDDTVGAKVGPMFTSLATHITDPLQRLLAIGEHATRAKELRHALSAHGHLGITEITPPGLLSLAARLYTAAGAEKRGPVLYNVIVSDVHGPEVPLYMAGARLTGLYPMGPLILGGGLNITAISYCGSLNFGFLTCPETVPETAFIAEGIPIALDELERAAGISYCT